MAGENDGAFERQRALWEAGAAFVAATVESAEDRLADSIESIAVAVGADALSIWRSDLTAKTTSLRVRGYLSEDFALDADEARTTSPTVVDSLFETNGGALLSLDTVIDADVVASNGWEDGQVIIVLVDLGDGDAETLVAVSLEGEWGAVEVDFFRGFATMIRQFRARIDVESKLAYRLRLEGLVSRVVGAMVDVDEASFDDVIEHALDEVCTFFDGHLVRLSSLRDDRVEVDYEVGTTMHPDWYSHEVPRGPGFWQSDGGPVLCGAAELATAMFGAGHPAVAEAKNLQVAIFTAALSRRLTSLLVVVRDEELWLPEEQETLATISATLGQARARVEAESWSAFRLEVQEEFATVAAQFLHSDSADADAVIADALEVIARRAGAGIAMVADLDDRDHLSARITSCWSSAGHGYLVGRSIRHPSVEFGEQLYTGEVAVAVNHNTDGLDPEIAAAIDAEHADCWTAISAPISGPGARSILGMAWSGDQTERLSVLQQLMSAMADLIGELKLRAGLETASARQTRSQQLLREIAVLFAETGEPEFDRGLATSLGLIGNFLNLTELSNWRVDDRGERYVLRHGWGVGADRTGASVPFGDSAALDKVRINENLSCTAIDTEASHRCAYGRGGTPPASVLMAERSGAEALSDSDCELLRSFNQMVEQIEERLASERYSDTAFGLAPFGIVLRDQDRRLITCNPAFLAFVGAESVDQVAGTLPAELLEADQPEPTPGKEVQAAFRRLDGRRVWGLMHSIAIETVASGEPMWLVHVEDISHRRRAEQLLRFQATHDELTGLANRRELRNRAEQILDGPGSAAMLTLDLDRFKLINDSLGHDKGDELLVVVADRIRLAVRPADLVARLGGDEFAVLIPGPTDIHEARRIADRLLSMLGEPVLLGSQQIFPTVSIGIAVADAESTVPDLLRRSDTAMYRAKSAGRSRHETFDEDLREEVTARMATEAGLRRALRDNEFVTHFQPEVSLQTGAVLGAEALVRWQHPEKGLLAAATFIEVAEETGLVVEMGAQVLRDACAEAASWTNSPETMIRVNFAAAQLQRSETVDLVAATLAEFDLAPERLCVEITESAMMEDVERAERILHDLKALGVRLAVDDFGTGFSSLAYLKRFPVDALKIDREFVIGVGQSEDDNAFVGSIVSLADALGLDVVAEGVEEPEQAAALLRLGCHRAQGYLFGRPGPASDLRQRLGIEVS